MLTLSNKAQEMPATPIRKMVPNAEEAKKRGIKVYHLNIGQPDIESPKEALDAVKNANLKVIAYSNSAGNESYRKGLLKYYAGIGINLNMEALIVTASGSEAVSLAISVTCNPGDEIIVMEPFYTNYRSFAIQNDVKLVPFSNAMEATENHPLTQHYELPI